MAGEEKTSNDFAWDLHKDADSILHSRVQTYLLAQTFLMAAFASILANGNIEKYRLSLCALAAIIGLSAIAISFVTRRKTMQIVHGLRWLKKNKLNNNSILTEYLEAIRKASGSSRYDAVDSTSHAYAEILPKIVEVMWGFALLCLAGLFFWAK